MIARGIREYLGRDWALVRRNKDEYWQQRISRLGVIDAFRAADALRRQALLVAPGWPTDRQRDDDLRDHAYLSDRLRRASPPIGR